MKLNIKRISSLKSMYGSKTFLMKMLISVIYFVSFDNNPGIPLQNHASIG